MHARQVVLTDAGTETEQVGNPLQHRKEWKRRYKPPCSRGEIQREQEEKQADDHPAVPDARVDGSRYRPPAPAHSHGVHAMRWNGNKVRLDRYDYRAPSVPVVCPQCHGKLAPSGQSNSSDSKDEVRDFYCSPCRVSVQVRYYQGQVVSVSASATVVEDKK